MIESEGEGMEELKKCQRCGCGNIVFSVINSIGHIEDNFISFIFKIECKNCKSSLPILYHLEIKMGENGEIEIIDDDREVAVEAWNRQCANTNKDTQ
ncbi:MAG: thioredoxin family protein [Ruminococcus flavefaciens]|nr:thioredoxin family protein [Ruminococcus flavefaciens]